MPLNKRLVTPLHTAEYGSARFGMLIFPNITQLISGGNRGLLHKIVTIDLQTSDHPGSHTRDEAGKRTRENSDFA